MFQVAEQIRYLFTSVEDIVQFPVCIVVEGRILTTIRLVLPTPVVIREISLLCLHGHVLQYVFLLGDGDEDIFLVQFLEGLFHEGVGCQWMQDICFCRGDEPRRG